MFWQRRTNVNSTNHVQSFIYVSRASVQAGDVLFYLFVSGNVDARLHRTGKLSKYITLCHHVIARFP